MSQWHRRDIIETVGVVAIVVSLIFLAVEMRQNTNALLGESRQAVLSASIQELNLVFDNPDLTLAVIAPGPLSAEEQIRLDAWYAMVMRAREFGWLQYRAGAIDRAQWDTEVNVLHVIFDASRARDWWGALGRYYVSEEFAEFVNGELERVPPTNEIWPAGVTWAD
jgi:hypothetical protein